MIVLDNRIEGSIFSPERISEATLKLIIEGLSDSSKGIVTGIPGLDGKGKLMPWRKGWLITILGYTSSGKSSLANRIMRNNATGIVEAGLEKKIVVTATWEQSVEEQGIYGAAQLTQLSVEDLLLARLSKQDVERMIEATKRRAKLPWWLIGRRRRPRCPR